MNEIEVKVLNIDINIIKNKLTELNAKLVKKEFQVNYMFDFENNHFFDKGGYVRIRKSHDFLKNTEKIVLTSKELISKDKFKISKEIEFNSDNFESSKDFLENLGLKLRRIDEKYRESYKLDEGLIEIDTWAGVPTYLEAEAETEENVVTLLSKLGYELNQSTSMTLAEIMKHYNIKNDNRTFSQEDKKQMGL
jgi:adenylate cyclase class 2